MSPLLIPSLRSTPTIYLLLPSLVLYTNHRSPRAEPHTANLDALAFSVNKSPPSEVEHSEYFPQLISRPLTIHTCPSCYEKSKKEKHPLWTYDGKTRTMVLLKDI